jgi:FMN reductase (NADPH)
MKRYISAWGDLVQNSVLELIYRHGSVRKYKPDPVSPEIVETIIAAAQRSSTSSNLQLWTAVAVTDQATRARLAQVCGNQAHIVEAPVFLAWCADLGRLDRVCELRGYTQMTDYVENFLVAALDVGIAAQTAALGAESLGLGICYIGAIRNSPKAVVELLALPNHVFPVAGMTIGWPDDRPPLRPRLPTRAVLHWEHYDRDCQDSLLHEYDKTMIETGIYNGRQVAVPNRPGEIEDYGWLEHSARRVSQPTRTGLREALARQGFELK